MNIPTLLKSKLK